MWAWIFALLPALLGLGIALMTSMAVLDNPELYLRADFIAIASRGGLLLSLLAGIFVYFRNRALKDFDQKIKNVYLQTAEDRRRFLQRLDHELKNPLTAIQAGLVNLRETTPDEARKDRLTSVQAQTLRISRLVADLRKLVVLETSMLERTAVDLAGILEEIMEIAEERIGEDARRITLSIPQAPWPLPKVGGDPDLLFLAVHNLVDNAIKFTKTGDTIEIRAFEDGADVVIEVADTGQGIPTEDVPYVWEELYRGVSARGVPGSGLGLALVRAIVDLHGGKVNLRSRPGEGTVFTIRLPVAATHQQKTAEH